MDRRVRRGGLWLAAAALALAVGVFTTSVGAQDVSARAILRDQNGDPVGVVKFTQLGRAVLVEAAVQGQTPGFHGFHVHANNDPTNGSGCVADATMPSSTWFVSADGHYKSADTQVHPSHAADMPVLLVGGNGKAVASFKTGRLAVEDIIGKAVIVHALPDNYANIPLGTDPAQYRANSDDPTDIATATGKTLATGNAGDRYACGVIRVS